MVGINMMGKGVLLYLKKWNNFPLFQWDEVFKKWKLTVVDQTSSTSILIEVNGHTKNAK